MNNKKNRNRLFVFVSSLMLMACVTGCQSDALTGSLIGGGAGAGIGYAIGNELDKINIWDAINGN